MTAASAGLVECVEIADSAHRHGVAEPDMLHALRNYVETFHVSEGMTMVIGPSGTTGALLELGLVEKFATDVLVHAMPARNRVRGDGDGPITR